MTTQDYTQAYLAPTIDGRTVGQSRVVPLPPQTGGAATDPTSVSQVELPDFPYYKSGGANVVGSKRGFCAIDLQGRRSAASQIASNDYSIVIGCFNSVKNAVNVYGGIAIGLSNTIATHDFSVAIGKSCAITTAHAFVFGENCSSSAENSVVIGTSNDASGGHNVVVGHNSVVSNSHCSAIGYNCSAAGYGAFAAGYNANAYGSQSVSIGSFTHSDGNYSIAVGTNCSASNDYGIALGGHSKAIAERGVAVQGASVDSSGNSAVAFNQTQAWRFGEFAIGSTNNAAVLPEGMSIIQMEITTSNATPTDLICGGAGGKGTTCLLIPSNHFNGNTINSTLHAFLMNISAFNNDGSDAAMFTRQGMVKMTGGPTGTAALVGSIVTIGTDNNTPALAVSITADNTTKSLKVTVTGAAGKTYHWRATIYANITFRS